MVVKKTKKTYKRSRKIQRGGHPFKRKTIKEHEYYKKPGINTVKQRLHKKEHYIPIHTIETTIKQILSKDTNDYNKKKQISKLVKKLIISSRPANISEEDIEKYNEFHTIQNPKFHKDVAMALISINKQKANIADFLINPSNIGSTAAELY